MIPDMTNSVPAALPAPRSADERVTAFLAAPKIGRAHVELQSLMRISYAVFCLKKKNNCNNNHKTNIITTLTHTKHNEKTNIDISQRKHFAIKSIPDHYA